LYHLTIVDIPMLHQCASCCADLDQVSKQHRLALRPIPPVDLFLPDRDKAISISSYPLEIVECSTCSLIQVTSSPDPSLFYENYIYTSSSSPDMAQNFETLSTDIISYISGDLLSGSVLDIGCNDGLFLSTLQKHLPGWSYYGIDPSPVTQRISSTSIVLKSGYFPACTLQQAGTLDVIVSTNSFAHIPDIHLAAAEVLRLLKKDGLFVVEVSDFTDMVQLGAWDYIYHEHLYYYTLSSLRYLLEGVGLSIVTVKKIPTKGGSLRVIAKKGNHSADASLSNYSSDNASMSHLNNDYEEWLLSVQEFVDSNTECSRVYGYGACATASVAMHQHPFFSNLSAIIDDNPNRQGLYSPGYGHKVVPLESISLTHDDCVIIFAWRFSEAIVRRIHDYCYEMNYTVPKIVSLLSLNTPLN